MHDTDDKNATGVQIFKNPIFGDIRIATTDKGPFFCLADLCKAVSLSNPSSVRNRLDDDDVQLLDLHALNYTEGIGNSKANFVSESGFYDVLLQSSSPSVKPFRKWVTSEVLPAIRKNGGYIAASQEETPEQIMAKALIVAQKTIEANKQKLQILQGENEVLVEERKALAPKAAYTNEVLQSTSTFTLTQVAHDLGFRSVYAFTAWAKEKGLLFYQSGQWQPTANVSGKGYFTTRTARYVKNDNTIGTSLSTVVTEKGRMFLHGLRKWGA